MIAKQVKVGPWEQIAELDDIDEAEPDHKGISKKTPMSLGEIQMSL